MKRIFEHDSPSNVEVLENDETIRVTISKTPQVQFYTGSKFPRSVTFALDHNGIAIFQKKRSRPHRAALIIIAFLSIAHVVLSWYLYQKIGEPEFIIYVIFSALPYLYLFENKTNIKNFLNQFQRNRDQIIFEQSGTDKYNVFVDFNKQKRTVHPYLDRELFGPKGFYFHELIHIETQPKISDCKSFPIDESATFVYDLTRSFDIKYRYGLRQSQFGFDLRASDAGIHKGVDVDPNLSLTAILNEIIKRVRENELMDDYEPFNPMD